MFETISVLVVFFFLMAFGFAFYSRQQQTSALRNLDEGFDLKTIDIIQRVSNLPELQCSSENIIKENCFDLGKVNSFAGIASNHKQYYHSLFDYSKIRLELIYPDTLPSPPPSPAPPPPPWELYNNEPLEWSYKSEDQIPMSLYDARERKYYATVLIVEVYR